MVKIFLILIFFSLNIYAAEKPVGFLWYNNPAEKEAQQEVRGKAFNELSFTQKDALLRFYTMEALHKARHTKDIKDMQIFLRLQDYWLKESTEFSSLFKKTLLKYPELDYTVTHPTSNIGSKILDENRQKNVESKVLEVSKTHGLLFFYRGSNEFDKRQVPIIKNFSDQYNFALIPVSVDGELSEFESARLDKGEAEALGVNFFPAILLVNPHSKETIPVAYGITTQDVLAKNIFLIATNFQGEA